MRLDDDPEIPVRRDPEPGENEASASVGCGTAGGLARLDSLELESLMLNLDVSLRIHTRHQFFGWTQGALQSLVKHELLICASRNGGPALSYVDSFSTIPVEPKRFNELFRQDVSLVGHVIKTWEENHCQSVICETGNASRFAGSALARELHRLDASNIVAHGTHDAAGQLTSFFTFACRPGAIGPKQAYLVELVVPFLHSAWVRTQAGRPAGGAGVTPAVAGRITSRELEILKWLYHGKSNIEIGMILAISPLTVKNHVQKILRKLNVLNRTQAVGKALALRILSS